MKIVSVKKIGKRPVYDISVQDVEHYFLENGVVSHNTGLIYSSNQAFIISKAQEKEGNELSGFSFTLNVEKSRFVREKSKFPFTVTFEKGINKYSGLLDIALELNFVVKPSMGWYARIDTKTGEIEEKKYRAKDTNTKEFWEPILNSQEFKDAVYNRYSISSHSIISDEEIQAQFAETETEEENV